MQLTDQKATGFKAELKLIPGWAWFLAVTAFISLQFVFNVAIPHSKNPPPPWACTLLGLLVGVIGAGYMLLVGYVCLDAGRRGMSRVLWTMIAMLVPNCLGFILYFILRQPLVATCPQCGAMIQPGFNFCPRCNCKLNPSCPQCQRMVRAGDTYCPYCGTATQNPTDRPGVPQLDAHS